MLMIVFGYALVSSIAGGRVSPTIAKERHESVPPAGVVVPVLAQSGPPAGVGVGVGAVDVGVAASVGVGELDAPIGETAGAPHAASSRKARSAVAFGMRKPALRN